MTATVKILGSWGGFLEPTRDLFGNIIQIHDIAEVWSRSGQEDFAQAVLLNKFGDKLSSMMNEYESYYELFESIRDNEIREMSNLFWERHESTPRGFHIINLKRQRKAEL